MEKQHQIIAEKILEVIGKEQILQVENCMTRLRLTLAADVVVDQGALQAIEGILGINETKEELQIVLGPGRVNGVCDALKQRMASNGIQPDAAVERGVPSFGHAEELHNQVRAKNATPFKLAIKSIASIFLPLIPAFIACGLITGCLNVILKVDPTLADYASIQLLKVAGNAVFFGLLLFVGVNAAKVFGGSPVLGGMMAAIISHPALSDIQLFDHALQPGRGGVIAVIFIVAFSSWLEKKVRQYVPEMFSLFLTPLVVIVLSTFVAIFALQPLGGMISEGIGAITYASIEQGGAFTGFILGGTFLPLVMTGLHQGLTPIHADLLFTKGVTILLPILAMAGAGQVGASFAVYCKTKNPQLKRTITSALPVGILGVGEPLIYGVTLPLGKPFVGACIGGAFGGAVQAYFQVGATAIGLSGLPLVASTDHMLLYFCGLVVSYIAGFIATWLIGFDDPKVEEGWSE